MAGAGCVPGYPRRILHDIGCFHERGVQVRLPSDELQHCFAVPLRLLDHGALDFTGVTHGDSEHSRTQLQAARNISVEPLFGASVKGRDFSVDLRDALLQCPESWILV